MTILEPTQIQISSKMATETSLITLYSIIGFLLFENIIELYLTFRQVIPIFFCLHPFTNEYFIFLQIRVYKTSRDVPTRLKSVMTQETFEKARVYGLDKANFSVFKSIVCDVSIKECSFCTKLQ